MKNLKRYLRRLVVKLVSLYQINNGDFPEYDMFDYWRENGFYLIPNNYYQPIPNASEIAPSHFRKKFEMVGVDMSEKFQLEMLEKFRKFKKEYRLFEKIDKRGDDQTDSQFYFNNLAFDGVDALVYYCMIRLLRPRKVVEVGSGWSTKVAAQASVINKDTQLISIEPYPQPILDVGFPGLSKLIKKKIEEVPLDFFDVLRAGDVLFIDSTHTVKIAGDVNYLFLEVLPRLKKGVYVHIHDIFFPRDYPRQWVMDMHRFWAEQYLLHAFLLFNDAFKIVYANSYMCDKYPEKVKNVFPNSPSLGGGSIWLKKIK